jgi:hypothetical protein
MVVDVSLYPPARSIVNRSGVDARGRCGKRDDTLTLLKCSARCDGVTWFIRQVNGEKVLHAPILNFRPNHKRHPTSAV